MLWAAAAVVAAAVGVLVGDAEAKGTYSVVAPRVLRPNRDFHVGVSTFGTEGDVQVNVEVGGRQDSGGEILNRQIADLRPDSTQVLKFQIGELGPGQYNLSVSGSGALTFRNTTELQHVHKSYSVFIQTDKTIYKPGDLMRFRVVVVNPHLRPSVTGAIDVYVTDGAGNRVRQWKRVFTNRGVWSGELQLADEPVLGDWNITVEVLGQTTSRTVQVAYYMLPKFEVIVTLPEYATFDQGEMVATVEAKYTYGKAVKGEVTLQVTPTYKYGYLQAPYDDPIRVVKQIKGKTDLTIDLQGDARLKGDYAREIEVTAYVKEELTGRVQNATSHVTVYRYPYRLSLVRTSDSFKPGLKYTAFLKVAYQDDTPITAGEVTVRHSFTRDPNGFKEEVHQIPESGIITLDFLPPLNDEVVSLALEARYKDLTHWLGDIVRAQSPSNSFLQATLLTQNPRTGGEILIGLNATQPMVYFVYQVMGRGDVVFGETLQAHQGTTHTFRFLATRDMAPRARLLVYYMRADGEVVADSLHFAVGGAIQNEVTVNLTPNLVDAGGEVDIIVTTKPNAFVGVLAVDQRALMVGTNNHFTQEEVIEELESYDPGRRNLDAPWHNLHRRKRALFNWMGTTTTADVFKNAGLVVLTNGYIHDFNPFLTGNLPPGDGPIDGSQWDPFRRPAAINGSFGRQFAPVDASTVRPDLGPGVAYNSPTRPPLAGPYAFSYLPPPPDSRPRLYLNQHIPPTWLFIDAETKFNGVVRLREKAPDAITSYMVSAFAIDDLYGLGVTEQPNKLRVFRPFFVSMHLPAAGVVRGEAVAVEMVVFNYGDQQVTAQVTLANPNGDFLFADFANEIDQGSPSGSKSREIVIASGSGVSVSFMVVPQTLGNIPITVRANTPTAADVVTKQLLVKPEGSRQTVNKAMLIDLRSEPTFSATVNITTPPNIVNGSKAISVTLIGDLLGPAVSDLQRVVELPTGCGEQNMAKLVPNIVVMEYLKNKNQLDEALQGRAKRHMETGYQQQLNYRHKDGSFSAFGSRDKSGSTWLTAFVAKSLTEAGRHIEVEPEVVAKAVEWLMQQQAVDGSFPEVGIVVNEAMQGGAAFGSALTAYVVMALLTTQNPPTARVKNSINKGLDFLATRLDDIQDLYSLTLTTYAFHLAEHAHKDAAFYKLESLAKVKENEKWWESEPLNKTVETVVDATSLDVETTGYALLIYVHRTLTQDAIPIMRWLVRQRNQHGGFQSTQDTVVGLSGLAGLAERLATRNPQVNLRLIYGARGKNLQVNRGNAMMLQRVELPSDTETVQMSGSGSGVALVQVTYHYNVKVTGPKPAFSLDPQLDLATTDTNRLRLTSCIGYTAGNASNMAVMDVSLPSGYILDNDLIPGLYDYEGVKLVEKKPDSSGVLVYFDYLTPVEVCPTVTAYRVNKVAFQKRSAVRVYDYYDTSRQARQFYRPLPATLCDICDLDECDPSQCEEQIIELNRQLQDPEDVERPATVLEIDAGQALNPTLALIFITLLMAFLQH
ncbi:thioester-containing protein 1 allele S3-like isoform X2 [Eriocheir sinensis]|uniref:thioester-containing protein 1 allele S3-like isoform X2 n=1 Tax=Eriocheir sinensis TaxID=95602 RepID=UPI0021C6C04B|nr:thioester-containing protein 1 allele S3-like isoform X2 [Eriocheir sinensis]